MMRIGHGYDVHRLVQGRRLVLGGVDIPHETGLLGHSDADVLTHAVMDALLGAAAMGDIGKLFPDNDPAFAGADSLALLREVMARLHAEGYVVGNMDCTVLAQAPKLAPYIMQMPAQHYDCGNHRSPKGHCTDEKRCHAHSPCHGLHTRASTIAMAYASSCVMDIVASFLG